MPKPPLPVVLMMLPVTAELRRFVNLIPESPLFCGVMLLPVIVIFTDSPVSAMASPSELILLFFIVLFKEANVTSTMALLFVAAIVLRSNTLSATRL